MKTLRPLLPTRCDYMRAHSLGLCFGSIGAYAASTYMMNTLPSKRIETTTHRFATKQ